MQYMLQGLDVSRPYTQPKYGNLTLSQTLEAYLPYTE